MCMYQENSILLSVIIDTTIVTGLRFFKIHIFKLNFLTATMKTHGRGLYVGVKVYMVEEHLRFFLVQLSGHRPYGGH